MTGGTAPQQGAPRVVEVQVADAPDAWRAAGFRVDGDTALVGEVRVRLVGGTDETGPTGVVGWTLSGVEVHGDHLDGLPTTVAPADATETAPGPDHPNGAIGLDHIVVSTPDLDRTIGGLENAGLELRRIRDTTSYGSPMRQAFFRLGAVVLEVVSGDTGSGEPAEDSPAGFFGLALDVRDLDQTAALLGPGLGSIKPAVQAGRRIATFRHRQLGLSVAVAAMDDHGDR